MSEHKSLAAALAAVQANLPRVGKSNTADAGTFKYKYADLADISAAVLPLLAQNGLSFCAMPTLGEDGRFVLEYTLRFAGNGTTTAEKITGRYPLPANGSPQQIGSAITYARRYALSAVTGISPDEDDDGQAAPKQTVEEWQAAPVPSGAQIERYTLLLAAVDAAQNEGEIAATGPAVKAAKAEHAITPMQFHALAQRTVTRLAEMRKASEQVPAGPVDPPSGSVGEAPEPGSGQQAQGTRRPR